MERDKKIVFYDGECGFCNRSVQFILKRNRKTPFLYFASLQSDFTKKFFRTYNEPLPDLSSLVFFEEGRFHYKSEGAMRIAKYLKGYKWIWYIRFIPRFIRDAVYSLVARNRHKLSKKISCELLEKNERIRFLD